MGKRGKGEGSISRRKNGGWMAQYAVYTAEGRKLRSIYGKTCKEMAKKLAKALSDREQGLTFEAGKMTLEEYLERWLADSVRGTVRPSTFERHEQIVRIHVNPALGRVGLKNLTPPHVRRLLAEKLESGLASATVRKIHSTLHKALSQAVSDGLFPRNAADVKAPQPTPKEMRPLSEGEARTFLEAARGDRFEDTLPRPPAHLRHFAIGPGRAPKAGTRTLGARHDSYDPRHLLALPALDGRSGRRRDGRRSGVAVAGCRRHTYKRMSQASTT